MDDTHYASNLLFVHGELNVYPQGFSQFKSESMIFELWVSKPRFNRKFHVKDSVQWILSGVQSVQVWVNDPTWTSTGIHQWLPDHTIQYNRLTVQQSESRAKVPGWPWQFQSNGLTAIIQCSIHHSSYDTSVNSSSINPTSHNMFHHLLPFHVTQKALYSCAEAKLIINPI